jgi:hypothetical protein
VRRYDGDTVSRCVSDTVIQSNRHTVTLIRRSHSRTVRRSYSQTEKTVTLYAAPPHSLSANSMTAEQDHAEDRADGPAEEMIAHHQ